MRALSAATPRGDQLPLIIFVTAYGKQAVASLNWNAVSYPQETNGDASAGVRRRLSESSELRISSGSEGARVGCTVPTLVGAAR
jgi:hypothetical protein